MEWRWPGLISCSTKKIHRAMPLIIDPELLSLGSGGAKCGIEIKS
jgi:hypothetical protein